MNIYKGISCLLVASMVSGESWQWPASTPDSRADSSPAAAVRIDTKVRFIDTDVDTTHKIKSNRGVVVQQDEAPFQEAVDTVGFYNQPAGAGRYPVQVQAHNAPYRLDGNSFYPVQGDSNNRYSDGTLDSLQYCKCVIKLDCTPLPNSASACGAGKYLCCYRRPNIGHNNEFFNEIEDERPMLLPGHENIARPFPPPPQNEQTGVFGLGSSEYQQGHNQQKNYHNSEVLVGPEGPTGVIGPSQQNRGVLVGPEGPTGVIGPSQQNRGVLVGPEGPTGVISPSQQDRGVLVGPEGPTGIIGPKPLNYNQGPKDSISQSESAQRGVLVGPGGPTGIIGPAAYNRRLLVGPGGPTGIIGPNRQRGVLVGPGGPTGIIGPAGYGRQRGILVGPGGPTGSIGPGRQILVGPGGPTGYIGPQGYNFYGK